MSSRSETGVMVRVTQFSEAGICSATVTVQVGFISWSICLSLRTFSGLRGGNTCTSRPSCNRGFPPHGGVMVAN